MKSRKRVERGCRAEEKKKCACGNFCGGDGLCNACRSANGACGTSVVSERKKTAVCDKLCARGSAAKLAVLSSCPKIVGSEIIDYLSDMASTLVEDDDATPRGTIKDLEDSFMPLLDEYGVSTADIVSLCQMVISSAFSTARGSDRKHDNATKSTMNDTSLLCRVSNLMLMYGGSPEPLLNNTKFELARGHRYGVVGANGSGKTTLMARIAKKDIVGFPETIKVVHLKHDSIMKDIDLTTTVKQYADLQCSMSAKGAADSALLKVGFDSGSLKKSVATLSGGWQMRLALACAMAQSADLLLLDEPTNHLDVEAVSWLVEFINDSCSGQGGRTAMIVSHDSNFLDRVCTDVIHFSPDGKLNYHNGNFGMFKDRNLGGDEAKAELLLQTGLSGPAELSVLEIDRMVFPTSGKMNSTAKSQSIMTLKTNSFQYVDSASPVLVDVDVEVTATSRIGIVGKNGSGKSTLLALLAGRLKPEILDLGLWWRDGLRLAFVSQHSFMHLKDYEAMTPLEYIQLRFRRGFDMEAFDFASPISSPQMTERMVRLASRSGKHGMHVEALISRIDCESHFLYEVKWNSLGHAQNTFETIEKLREFGVESMAHKLDERMLYSWGGSAPRPLTTMEIVKHLEAFGFSEEMTCRRKICMLSSGQKCKLAFGAAFWTRPHVLCLDEPTNYLDVETIEILSRAIRGFRGACVVVSHSRDFVQQTCNEIWEVEHGKICNSAASASENTKMTRSSQKSRTKARGCK